MQLQKKGNIFVHNKIDLDAISPAVHCGRPKLNLWAETWPRVTGSWFVLVDQSVYWNLDIKTIFKNNLCETVSGLGLMSRSVNISQLYTETESGDGNYGYFYIQSYESSVCRTQN